MKRRELSFIIVVAVATIVLWLLPTGYENPKLTENISYDKGRITSIDNSDLSNISYVTIGTQGLELELLSGPFRGDTTTAKNIVLGDLRRDKIFVVGDRVLAVTRFSKGSGEIVECRAEDYYRQDLILLLVALFFLCLILFAGRTGAKAALSFIFTALTFWKLLIPAFLGGYSPLFVSIGVVFITTSVIILLVGGVSLRGCVAHLGAMTGVVATAILALIFGSLFKIPGTIQEYSDSLFYSGFSDLDFSMMFISCIFISSAGAVMDVAMDIAAAQDELRAKLPTISRGELVRSGLNIASPVVGSMTTTLLFAYSGSFMFIFMAFMAQGVPIESIINRGYISAEILHTIVGSFGLVLVAPLTALIGGYIYSSNRSK